jgi:hypothetical protein
VSEMDMQVGLQIRDLRERLDAALRRIEALELEVARLKSTADQPQPMPACVHDWAEPTTAGMTTCTKCFVSKPVVYLGDRYNFVEHHDLTGEPLEIKP